jgi:hypothetical protein
LQHFASLLSTDRLVAKLILSMPHNRPIYRLLLALHSALFP